jgi:MFS family permease
MLTSITPLGERGRNRNWNTTMGAYIVGSILGGAVTGIVAGILGALLPTSLRPAGVGFIVAGVLAVVVASELRWLRLTPIGGRQVNEDWLDEYRGWVVGLGFGFQLGLGVVTIVTTLAIPAAFILATLTHSVAWGAAIGVSFGVARALPILETRRVDRPDRLAELHRRHDRNGGRVQLVTALASLPLLVAAVML